MKKISKKQGLLIGGGILLAALLSVAIYLFMGYREEQQKMAFVMEFKTQGMTYQEAYNSFFQNPKWSYDDTDPDGPWTVFTGRYRHHESGENQEYRIQFERTGMKDFRYKGFCSGFDLEKQDMYNLDYWIFASYAKKQNLAPYLPTAEITDDGGIPVPTEENMAEGALSAAGEGDTPPKFLSYTSDSEHPVNFSERLVYPNDKLGIGHVIITTDELLRDKSTEMKTKLYPEAKYESTIGIHLDDSKAREKFHCNLLTYTLPDEMVSQAVKMVKIPENTLNKGYAIQVTVGYLNEDDYKDVIVSVGNFKDEFSNLFFLGNMYDLEQTVTWSSAGPTEIMDDKTLKVYRDGAKITYDTYQVSLTGILNKVDSSDYASNPPATSDPVDGTDENEAPQGEGTPQPQETLQVENGQTESSADTSANRQAAAGNRNASAPAEQTPPIIERLRAKHGVRGQGGPSDGPIPADRTDDPNHLELGTFWRLLGPNESLGMKHIIITSDELLAGKTTTLSQNLDGLGDNETITISLGEYQQERVVVKNGDVTSNITIDPFLSEATLSSFHDFANDQNLSPGYLIQASTVDLDGDGYRDVIVSIGNGFGEGIHQFFTYEPQTKGFHAGASFGGDPALVVLDDTLLYVGGEGNEYHYYRVDHFGQVHEQVS